MQETEGRRRDPVKHHALQRPNEFLVYAKKIKYESGERNEGAHPGYDRADQYPPNGQQPKTSLHDPSRLQNDVSLRALLRDAPPLPFLPLLRLGGSEPAKRRRRLDVRERDQAQRDRQRRGRVGVRERREREERLRVEHARWLRQPGEEHRRAHEQRELRERRDGHSQPGMAAVFGVQFFAPRDHLGP